jgi:hypothetical protein
MVCFSIEFFYVVDTALAFSLRLITTINENIITNGVLHNIKVKINYNQVFLFSVFLQVTIIHTGEMSIHKRESNFVSPNTMVKRLNVKVENAGSSLADVSTFSLT